MATKVLNCVVGISAVSIEAIEILKAGINKKGYFIVDKKTMELSGSALLKIAREHGFTAELILSSLFRKPRTLHKLANGLERFGTICVIDPQLATEVKSVAHVGHVIYKGKVEKGELSLELVVSNK